MAGAPAGVAELVDGAAYVFRDDAGTWREVQRLLPSDPSGQFPWDGFGNAITLECGTLVVGSPYHCHQGICAGSAYVFRHHESGYVEEQELLASDLQPK